MAARIYICDWWLEASNEPGVQRVNHTIAEKMDELEAQGQEPVYGSPALNTWRRDDLPWCVAIVRADDHSAFQGLAGVHYTFPAYRLDKPWAEVPETVKLELRAAMQARGVPLSHWSGDVIVRDTLQKLHRYVWPNARRNPPARDAEFG